MRPAALLVLVAATAGTACARPRGPSHSQSQSKKKPMDDCTKTIDPGASLSDAIAALPSGGVLCLSPGRYPVNVVIDKPLTLRGLPGGEVVLDGGGRASVIKIAGDKPAVTIERVTITGGANRDGGGGLASPGFATLLLREVTLAGNRADGFGGGALYVAGGSAVLERCRVVENGGGVGGALIVDGVANLVLRATLVADNRGSSSVVYAHDAARLALDHATIAGNHADAAIEVRAITVRAPAVTISDSIVAGTVAIANGPRLPGNVVATRTLLSGGQVGVTDGGGNRAGDPLFASTPPEPYRPGSGSPAIGLAEPGDGLDLAGAPSGTTAGALQP